MLASNRARSPRSFHVTRTARRIAGVGLADDQPSRGRSRRGCYAGTRHKCHRSDRAHMQHKSRRNGCPSVALLGPPPALRSTRLQPSSSTIRRASPRDRLRAPLRRRRTPPPRSSPGTRTASPFAFAVERSRPSSRTRLSWILSVRSRTFVVGSSVDMAHPSV
jgi:hypothetical protein